MKIALNYLDNFAAHDGQFFMRREILGKLPRCKIPKGNAKNVPRTSFASHQSLQVELLPPPSTAMNSDIISALTKLLPH